MPSEVRHSSLSTAVPRLPVGKALPSLRASATRQPVTPEPELPTRTDTGLTPLELAQLAATLSSTLKKPPEQCFGEAEELHREAKMWVAGIDEFGSEVLFQFSEETVLKGESSLGPGDGAHVFPELEVDVYAVTPEGETKEDHPTVRAITWWRSLRETIPRLVQSGLLGENDPVVTEFLEQRKVVRSGALDINRARVKEAAISVAKRLGAVRGSAKFRDPASSRWEEVQFEVSELKTGTGRQKAGTGHHKTGRSGKKASRAAP